MNLEVMLQVRLVQVIYREVIQVQKPKVKENKDRSAKEEDSYDDQNISDASGEV